MRIRTDFVTNSSSSSFLTVRIKSGEIAKIIEKYKDCFEESGGPSFAIRDDTISFSGEVMPGCDLYRLDNILEKLISILAIGYSEYSDMRDYFSDEHPKGLELLDHIEECKKELLDSIESVSWDTGDCGDGGDSFARFNHSYSDNDIRKCLVLSEDTEIDEAIREEFNDFLDEASSNEMTEFRYKRGSFPTRRSIYELDGITLSDDTEVVSISDELTKYSAVVGTQYEGREERIKLLKNGEILQLVREPKNAYDANAINVVSRLGSIGYIPAPLAKKLAPIIDSKKLDCAAVLETVSRVTSSENKQYYRVIIQMEYKPT